MDFSTLIAAFVTGLTALGAAAVAALATKRSSQLQEPPDVKAIVNETSKDGPIGIQQIAKAQLEISNNYYKIVLQQSKQSFTVAVIFGSVGLTFFITAIVLLIYRDTNNSISYVSIVGGALTEFISAVNFYLYGRASQQLETFHIRLDKTQLIILADSICESLGEDMKFQARADLVGTVASSLLPNALELKASPGKSSRAKTSTKSQRVNSNKAQEESQTPSS